MGRDKINKMLYDMQKRDMIKMHEGYREAVYIDSVGVPTGGYGHAFHVGSTLPQLIWEEIFVEDLVAAERDLERLMDKWNLHHISDPRKLVLLDMMYNLGYSRLSKFRKMLTALREGKYQNAASEMVDSKWYRQVGQRGKNLVKAMATNSLVDVMR